MFENNKGNYLERNQNPEDSQVFFLFLNANVNGFMMFLSAEGDIVKKPEKLNALNRDYMVLRRKRMLV